MDIINKDSRKRMKMYAKRNTENQDVKENKKWLDRRYYDPLLDPDRS